MYGIVKQSGGDILVESEPGRGTHLHGLPAGDATRRCRPTHGGCPPTRATARPETVLLVEDDDAVREFAREVLRSRGWRVVEARPGRGAGPLHRRRRRCSTSLVTDVVMPGLTGGELADRLEVLRPGVPVLFVSGYADVDVIGRGQLRAGRQLLSKPFTGAELAYRVQELFAAARPGPNRRRH